MHIHEWTPPRKARTALRLRMLAAARSVGDIRSDAALFSLPILLWADLLLLLLLLFMQQLQCVFCSDWWWSRTDRLGWAAVIQVGSHANFIVSFTVRCHSQVTSSNRCPCRMAIYHSAISRSAEKCSEQRILHTDTVQFVHVFKCILVI